MRYSVLDDTERILASRRELVLRSEDELRAELDRDRTHLAKQNLREPSR